VAGPSGTRRWRFVAGSAAVITAMVLTLVATSAGATAQSRHATPLTHASVVIDSAKHGSLGTILVTKAGYTLYYDKSDTTTKIACTGGCAGIWPPVLLPGGVSSATAGPGVTQSSLGVVHRPAGGRQVTYAGHPLYRYVQDASPGQVKGEGVGGFYVVKADMKKSSAPTTTTPGGGGTTTTMPWNG
jgi:predicted lipoprotein with Yx(FWY)xxD motif